MALVIAGSAFSALAQESGSTTPTPAPLGHKFQGRGGHMLAAWKFLTPEEQQKLMAVRKSLKNNPEFMQAREKMKEQAKAFRETRRAAMLKADPTIAPILEKLEAARKQKEQPK